MKTFRERRPNGAELFTKQVSWEDAEITIVEGHSKAD
jgi:hypothetical protein